jgi:hypothetical protein
MKVLQLSSHLTRPVEALISHLVIPLNIPLITVYGKICTTLSVLPVIVASKIEFIVDLVLFQNLSRIFAAQMKWFQIRLFLTHIRTVGNSTGYNNHVIVHDFKVATASLDGNEEFDKTTFRYRHSSDEFAIFENHRKVDN